MPVHRAWQVERESGIRSGESQRRELAEVPRIDQYDVRSPDDRDDFVDRSTHFRLGHAKQGLVGTDESHVSHPNLGL